MPRIEMPWAAWYGDRKLLLDLPDDWQIDEYALDSDKQVNDATLDKAVSGLADVQAKKRASNAVIVVDDLTRPVKLERLMPRILSLLNQSGIADKDIRILVGLGSHQGLSRENMQKKLGKEAVDRVTCLNHDPSDTVEVGVEWGKTSVKLNQVYVESELKIVISGLTPHSFAGFSGGAKMLYPGLADMETIAKTHKSVLMGFMGKLGDVAQNKFRNIIEEFVEKVGLDFFFGVVINGDRSMRSVHAGHYVDAHRAAAEEAAEYCRIQLKNPQYDIVISSAWPKDSELLQAENGFIPIKSAGADLLKPGGIFVLLSACSEGMGHHGLFGPGGLLFRKALPLRFLKDRRLFSFCENVSKEDFHHLYHESYDFFTDVQDLIDRAKSLAGKKPKVAVFPYGSMQIAGAYVG